MSATPPAPGWDKLAKDVSQYQQAQVARKHPRALQPPPEPGTRSTRHARPAGQVQAPWLDIDQHVGSQILVGLLIAGYAISTLAAAMAVFLLAPLYAPALLAVIAVGTIVSMIAYHKGRPPLLWLMYGSTLTMIPPVFALLVGHLAGTAAGPKAVSGLGDLGDLTGGLLGSNLLNADLLAGLTPTVPGAGVLEVLLFALLLGAIPLVHALLVSPVMPVVEARQIAQGMRRCPHCAELIRAEATVCRFCQRDCTKT